MNILLGQSSLPNWGFGFDCYHAFDYAPGMSKILREAGSCHWEQKGYKIYRDFENVKAECANLAKQLSQVVEGQIVRCPPELPSTDVNPDVNPEEAT